MKPLPEETFYGSTTVGEKGQIVIPVSARKALTLKRGDKMLVFGVHGMVMCAKIANLQKVASHFAQKAAKIQSLITKA